MKKLSRFAIPVLILAASVLIMWGLLGLKTDPPRRPAEPRTKVVETTVVQRAAVTTQITAYGRVTSSRPVTLVSEVAGVLQSGTVDFKTGQSFSKGDLLVKVDDRQARLSLNSALSDLLSALASVLPEIKVDFPDEYEKWQDFFNTCQFDQKVAPLPETTNSKVKLFLSRFAVYKLYFAVVNLEIILDKHYFLAPFDGSIVSAAMQVGSSVRSGTLLGAIISLDRMEVLVPLDVKDVQWIDQTQPVQFSSSELVGQWSGKIIRVGSAIDNMTQTIPMTVLMDDQPGAGLAAGIFLEATMMGLLIDDAQVIPPKAIYQDRFVYLIVGGKLDRRAVEIIRRESDRVIITGGIQDGDTLVVELMQGVAAGMSARSRSASTEAPKQ
jgi:membrane fusion protein (multidrug efflux system)